MQKREDLQQAYQRKIPSRVFAVDFFAFGLLHTGNSSYGQLICL
jgi:hypothetical protein